MRTILRTGSCIAAMLICASVARAQSGEFKVIYTFTGGSDGGKPRSGLTLAKGGVLYGTTWEDALDSPGTVFSLAPPVSRGGVWTLTTIFELSQTNSWYEPVGGLAIDRDGNLFGTTQGGGSQGGGVAFSLTPPLSGGSSWADNLLYTFADSSVGWGPTSSLVFGLGGAIYGTDIERSAVFTLVPPAASGGSWSAYPLHVFGSSPDDGSNPGEGLVVGKDGTLYGVTRHGGAYGSDNYGGTVYSVTPPAEAGGAWTELVLHSFGASGDGNTPVSILAIGEGEVLYGTTAEGGIEEGTGCGIVFSLTPPAVAGDSWAENILHTFTGGAEDGCGSAGGVTIGPGGVLYGATGGGGASDNGIIYSLTPPAQSDGAWTFALLYSFTSSDGSSAATSLAFGPGGALYGTAPEGGTGSGTVFAFKP